MIIRSEKTEIEKAVDLIIAVKKIMSEHEMSDEEMANLLRELADEIAE